MGKLPAVQLLRAFAALMVAFVHICNDAGFLASGWGQAFQTPGWLPWVAGVDLFFVISGFVMVYASQPLFAQPGATRYFLVRRFIRIAPIYYFLTALWLAIALGVPALLNSPSPSLAAVVASYAFWPWPNALGVMQPLYTLGWTLNYEMFFYTVFALALVLPQRKAIAAISSVFLIGVIGAALLPGLPQPVYFWFNSIILEFVFGMAIAAASLRGVVLPSGVRLLIGCLALALLHVSGSFDQLPRFLAWGAPAALCLAAVTLGRAATKPSRLLVAGALIGDASYAIYLIHPFVSRALRIVWQAGFPQTPALFIGVTFVAVVLVGIAAYTLFERPVTTALQQRFTPRKPRGSA